MRLFILTEDNVVAAKAALRAALPEVGSGHLTEALAAGLGFQTHAALRAAIAADAAKHPAIADCAPEQFAQRLNALGHGGVAPDAFALVDAAETLPETPYAFFKRGDRGANDRHYHACQRRGRPMIMVKMARRYAELEWDCITVDTSQEDYLHDRCGDELMRILFALFQARARGAPGKPIFFGSAFTGTIDKLLPDTARQLAEDYFKLLYLPLREPRGPRRRAA